MKLPYSLVLACVYAQDNHDVYIDPYNSDFNAHQVIYDKNKNLPPPEVLCQNATADTYIPVGYELKRCGDFDRDDRDEFRSLMKIGAGKFTYRENDKVVVPWFLSDAMPAERIPTLKANLQEQMDHIEKYTCIQFQERNQAHINFEIPAIKISPGNSCSATIGHVGPEKIGYMTLGGGCDHTFVHEVGHNFGYYHEHQRPDRRNFIKFNHQHATSTFWIQYDKIDSLSIDNLEDHGIGYDGNSELHYGTRESSEHKFSDLFGQSVSQSKDLTSDFYSQDPIFGYGWSLSRMDIIGWNKDHTCEERKIVRNTPGILRTRDRSLIISNIVFNDDDTFDFSQASFSDVIPGFAFHDRLENVKVGLIYANDNTFNIRDHLTTGNMLCYSAYSSTDCSSGQITSDDYSFEFVTLEAQEKVVMYNFESHNVDLSSSTSVDNNAVILSNMDIENVVLESGLFKYDQNMAYLPVASLCDYGNGFCEYYCNQDLETRTCSCAPGWELNTDGRTCSEVNECDQNVCGDVEISGAYCLNIHGADLWPYGYKCRCEWGMIWNYDLGACENPPQDQTNYDWFQIRHTENHCLTVGSSGTGLSLQACDANYGTNQLWRKEGNNFITWRSVSNHYEGYCLTQAGNGNGCSVMAHTYQGHSGIGVCNGDPSRDFSQNFDSDNVMFQLNSMCTGTNHLAFIARSELWGNALIITSADWAINNHYSWYEHHIPDSVKDSWVSDEMSEYSGDSLNEVVLNNWCLLDFQRTYTLDLENDGNDEIVCLDHRTGILQSYDYTQTELSEPIQNFDCIGDPLFIEVHQGPFSDSMNFLCYNKYDSSSPIVEWCQDSTYSGSIAVGDFNGDGYKDFVCYHFSGQTEFAFGSASYTSVSDFDFDNTEFRPMPRQEDFLTPYAGDFDNNGWTDLFFMHSPTGSYVTVKGKQPPASQVWTAFQDTPCLDVDTAADNPNEPCTAYPQDCLDPNGSWFGWAHSQCHKTCGNCDGTAECTNTRFDCSKWAKQGRCTEPTISSQCQLACGICDAVFPGQPAPVFDDSPINIEEGTSFCSGANKYTQIIDVNDDNKLDILCHDWVSGELSVVYGLGNGDFNYDGSVVLQENFCKSKYLRDASFEVDFRDQATGRFHALRVNGEVVYVCVAKHADVMYAILNDNSNENVAEVQTMPDSLAEEIRLESMDTEDSFTLALSLFEDFLAIQNEDTSAVSNLARHGCWCRQLGDYYSFGGDQRSETDSVCHEYHQCMKCTSCETGTGSDILISEDLQTGQLTCSDSLNGCDFDRCTCQLDFVSGLQNVSNWSLDVNNESDLDVGDCDVSNNTPVGNSNQGSTNQGSSNSGAGATGSSGETPVDACARRRRKRDVKNFGF